MICKRCEQWIPENGRHKTANGRTDFCRHCYQALVQAKHG